MEKEEGELQGREDEIGRLEILRLRVERGIRVGGLIRGGVEGVDGGGR